MNVASKLILFSLSITAGGCLTLTPEEQVYLDRAMEQPLTFTVWKNEAEDVWVRAHTFIGKYSSMKIQVATDYVLQTYNPTGGGTSPGTGYYVVRTPVGDEMEFDIQAVNYSVDAMGKRNAHILAYYMATGLPLPRRVSTILDSIYVRRSD